MKVVLVTQARSGSTRLPNKVLKKIKDKTLLQYHIDRIKMATKVDALFIATTVNEADNVIEELASQLNVDCTRGSENDVLDRYYQTVKNENADFIVRLTSDCPLIDAILLDEIISVAIEKGLDYYSNGLIESYPDGQDVEVFKFSALEKAWKEAKLDSEREHVTPYIIKNSSFRCGDLFKSGNHLSKIDYNNVRLTVDEPSDFEVIKQIINDLGENESWETYAKHYINSELLKDLNNDITRNEGYKKSIKKD
jgi:spore coat polysaccharide biosynthesis protein SpsF